MFVIGGGFAAAEESIFLTKFANHVTILIRGEDFSCAEAVAEQARSHEKIDVITNTVVEEVSGENGLHYIRYKNRVTKEVTEYRAKEGENFGVFVFVGYAPETELVKGVAKLNEQGYVITDKAQKTSVDGLYAAGDICVKPLRQVVTATSDGALAATELEKYVTKVQQRTGDYDAVGGNAGGLFTTEMRAQLEMVFSRMENPLVLKLYLDSRNLSKELEAYVKELVSMTDKLTMEVVEGHDEEFTSFVLGMYNAAGPGQVMEEDIKKRIQGLEKSVNIKILVTLSCSMCPDLVVAAQHIAAVGDKITTEVYDILHFESLKNKYKVMSVPCIVINDKYVHFGKKNMQQVLKLLENI